MIEAHTYRIYILTQFYNWNWALVMRLNVNFCKCVCIWHLLPSNQMWNYLILFSLSHFSYFLHSTINILWINPSNGNSSHATKRIGQWWFKFPMKFVECTHLYKLQKQVIFQQFIYIDRKQQLMLIIALFYVLLFPFICFALIPLPFSFDCHKFQFIYSIQT